MNGQNYTPIVGQTPFGEAFNPKGGGKFDYFFYSSINLSIAAAANGSSLVQFDADSQFLWIALSYQASIAGGALTEDTNVIPLVTIAIQDGGSGKYLMNQPIPLGAIAGDGKNPYRLIGPRVFQPSSTVNINWTNYSAATTYAPIHLVFHGIKLYT